MLVVLPCTLVSRVGHGEAAAPDLLGPVQPAKAVFPQAYPVPAGGRRGARCSALGGCSPRHRRPLRVRWRTCPPRALDTFWGGCAPRHPRPLRALWRTCPRYPSPSLFPETHPCCRAAAPSASLPCPGRGRGLPAAAVRSGEDPAAVDEDPAAAQVRALEQSHLPRLRVWDTLHSVDDLLRVCLASAWGQGCEPDSSKVVG